MVLLRRLVIFLGLIFVLGASNSEAQAVKRIVVVKIDGLPAHYVDRFVREKDPATGRSTLPWIEEVFYRNGTRLPNFYTRGMSLSGPSWGQVDSGQHMQIKGNVEFDRYTLHAYDYLNFLPYYINYGLGKRADMPAMEVMDQLGIPILSDAFDYDKRYTSQQLFQRGTNWEVLASGFVNLYPGNARDFIDEWTIGLNFRKITVDQSERDILGKLVKRPDIDYFDYYDVSFDHMSHHNNDTASRLNALKDLDRTIGRIWNAILSSSRADETAITLISDHGFNSDSKVYSQGFNLVKLLGSAKGGGHHVVTKRRLMLDYSVKGIYPLVPIIRTSAAEPYYLRGQLDKYPTALLDFDGNERSSLHLRNSDLNVLHILLQQLKHSKLQPAVAKAATESFFEVIDRNRSAWGSVVDRLDEELAALGRKTAATPVAKKKEYTPEEKAKGVDKADLRAAALQEVDVKAAELFRRYVASLRSLLALRPQTFDARRLNIEDLIAPGAMGEPNSIYQLQNYVAGPAPTGLVLDSSGNLDMGRSFTRINYPELLMSQRVRNNVQPGVSNRPIDFVAMKVPLNSFNGSLDPSDRPDEDISWIYSGLERQTIILTRDDNNGGRRYKYVPVTGLMQDANGRTTFRVSKWVPDLPLRYIEDDDFGVPVSGREAWLSGWHAEEDWMRAVHRTNYSNGIIGLNEQLNSHPVPNTSLAGGGTDQMLIHRFRQRQRHLTEADLLIVANDHWNFDVRGFNPGGNHGSFLRTSTNSTFMIAGGSATGIPRGLTVETPYDSLSFVPTILRLMGKIDDENRPDPDLSRRGFKRFPGMPVREIFGN